MHNVMLCLVHFNIIECLRISKWLYTIVLFCYIQLSISVGCVETNAIIQDFTQRSHCYVCIDIIAIKTHPAAVVCNELPSINTKQTP